MTEKQFWKELEKYAGQDNKIFDIVQLIRQAYEDDLEIVCGCIHIDPDNVRQLYINYNESDPNQENNRFMLCYTSYAMGKADPLLPEPCEKLPVRFVIDNAMSKPVIGGLLFNRHNKKKATVIPKQLFGDEKMVIDYIKKVTE